MENEDLPPGGRTPEAGTQPNRRAVVAEVLGLYAGTLLAIRGVVTAQASLGLPDWVLLLIPALFLYVPIFWVERKGEDPRALGMTLEGWWPAVRLNLVLLVTVLGPFVVANHLYQGLVFGRTPRLILPHHYLTQVVAYHLLVVALPEEFFYRGYMQSRLNQVFPKRLRFLGVSFGWGLFLTAILFAAGHSLVVVRWWHFSIFFPAVIFGWLRERTGNVLAPALFHALCNVLMVTLDTMYGVIPP